MTGSLGQAPEYASVEALYSEGINLPCFAFRTVPLPI